MGAAGPRLCSSALGGQLPARLPSICTKCHPLSLLPGKLICADAGASKCPTRDRGHSKCRDSWSTSPAARVLPSTSPTPPATPPQPAGLGLHFLLRGSPPCCHREAWRPQEHLATPAWLFLGSRSSHSCTRETQRGPRVGAPGCCRPQVYVPTLRGQPGDGEEEWVGISEELVSVICINV